MTPAASTVARRDLLSAVEGLRSDQTVVMPQLLLDPSQELRSTLDEIDRLRPSRRRVVLLTPDAQGNDDGQQIDTLFREAVDGLLGMTRIAFPAQYVAANQ